MVASCLAKEAACEHTSNHCLCLFLPPASAGLAFYSCVHLPSSSRASSKRYWSLAFSRFLFPVLLINRFLKVGSLVLSL